MNQTFGTPIEEAWKSSTLKKPNSGNKFLKKEVQNKILNNFVASQGNLVENTVENSEEKRIIEIKNSDLLKKLENLSDFDITQILSSHTTQEPLVETFTSKIEKFKEITDKPAFTKLIILLIIASIFSG
jgi:hypothetical protein